MNTALPRPLARADHELRRVGDEWLLFDPAGERLHVLNLAAALTWTHCTGDLTVREIAAAVAEAFGIPADQVDGEVAGVIERFVAEGVVELA